MNHQYRWRTTRYGDLHPGLQSRFGESCRVVTRGRNGSVWIAFADGAQFVVPRHAVRRAK